MHQAVSQAVIDFAVQHCDPRNDPFLIDDIRHLYKVRNEPYPLKHGWENSEGGKRYCKENTRRVLRIKIARLRQLRTREKDGNA